MTFWGEWMAERVLRQRAAAYVVHLQHEPGDEVVAWLAAHGTRGDRDHARWELRYARRAMGLVVAERDALDDRTASAVARELQTSLGRDRNIDADKLGVARTQLNARLRVYGGVLSHRLRDESTGARLGRALLEFAGNPSPSDAEIAEAGTMLAGFASDANEALRRCFGVASLPEDLPPSAVERASHAL